jgi:hypothetical protein
MKKVLAAAILLSFMPFNVIGMTSSSAEAATDVVCVDRGKFIERLKRTYGERQVSRGINFNGVMVEIFASREGHFTILATRPDGVSCLVASGDNWQETPLLKAEIGI